MKCRTILLGNGRGHLEDICVDEAMISNVGSKEVEELHDLYSSPSIVRMIKARRKKWAGHVTRMGEKVVGGKARGKEATRKTKT
jgi:hypothetical protein